MRVFIDSNIPIFAVGGESPERVSSRRLMRLAAEGTVELHASVELVQEFLFHRLRRVDRALAVAQARELSGLCVLHAFDAAVLGEAIALVESGELRGRDAVHAGTALQCGFSEIVSFDTGFGQCARLTRLGPDDVADSVVGRGGPTA